MHEELTYLALDWTVITNEANKQIIKRIAIIEPAGFLCLYEFVSYLRNGRPL